MNTTATKTNGEVNNGSIARLEKLGISGDGHLTQLDVKAAALADSLVMRRASEENQHQYAHAVAKHKFAGDEKRYATVLEPLTNQYRWVQEEISRLRKILADMPLDTAVRTREYRCSADKMKAWYYGSGAFLVLALDCLNTARWAANETQDWLQAFVFAATLLPAFLIVKSRVGIVTSDSAPAAPPRWLIFMGRLAVAVFILTFAVQFGLRVSIGEIIDGSAWRAWLPVFLIVAQMFTGLAAAYLFVAGLGQLRVMVESKADNPDRVRIASKLPALEQKETELAGQIGALRAIEEKVAPAQEVFAAQLEACLEAQSGSETDLTQLSATLETVRAKLTRASCVHSELQDLARQLRV
jgi:succinate dehydrogenase hydrophobic anchor subunit